MTCISSIVSTAVDAISIRYNNMVYEMRNKGVDVIVLSLGEAFFDIPLFAFDALPYPNIYHYSPSRGLLQLREKISKYYKSKYAVNFDPEKEIIITAGSKAAIYLVFKGLLNPGDEVLIIEPAWVSYLEQVKLCYGIPVYIPYDEDVLHYEKYLTEKTKLIVVNNPNNPSGKVYSKKELEYILYLAKTHNVFILSDEAYSAFVSENQFHSLGELDAEKKHVVICNSMSKNFGMSGWRIGYLIANSELTDQLLKINQHILTCAPTILQYYLAEYFDKICRVVQPQINSVVIKRHEIAAFMTSIGLHYLAGTSTFYFFVSINPSALTSNEFCMQLLNEEKISTVPGIGYGHSCDSFIRVSIGTEPVKKIQYAIARIKALIDKTSYVQADQSLHKKKST